MSNPIKTTAQILGLLPPGHVEQVPYCFTDTLVLFGSPPIAVNGLDAVTCRFLAPRAKRFASLGGGACFLSNRNTSGEIVLKFAQGAFSIGFMEMYNLAGVPMPLVISDISTGGTASVIGTGCRIIDPGDWERGEKASHVTMKLQADRMAMFHGLRLPEIAR